MQHETFLREDEVRIPSEVRQWILGIYIVQFVTDQCSSFILQRRNRLFNLTLRWWPSGKCLGDTTTSWLWYSAWVWIPHVPPVETLRLAFAKSGFHVTALLVIQMRCKLAGLPGGDCLHAAGLKWTSVYVLQPNRTAGYIYCNDCGWICSTFAFRTFSVDYKQKPLQRW